jgi:copper transporter 1
MGQLLSYLHFAPTGDLLWFGGWAPRKTGPMVGVCIGLFMLAVFERWLAACRALAERSWSRSYVLFRLISSQDRLLMGMCVERG